MNNHNTLKYINILLISFVLLGTSSQISYSKTMDGFTQICQIYTAALDSHMNIENMSDYIFSNISQRVKSKDALDAHEAVMQLDAHQRYKIFKQSAELSLKHKWSCASMKKVMAMKRSKKKGAGQN